MGERDVDAVREPGLSARPLAHVNDAAHGSQAGEEFAPLVRAARAGDRGAYGRRYERYAPMVHAVLLARIGRVEARDLVQDVFLVALERLPTLKDEHAFGAWLATIARYRAFDHRRSRRETVELPDDLPEPEHHASALETDARRALVAIRELPETYSETLLLRLVHGLSGPEISAVTGLTPGSVRVNLHRGMKLLRESLTRESKP